MNADELCTSSENARQDRNAACSVMFWKNTSQLSVEKLFDSVVSNACGNGVGSTGGVAGIVGTAVVDDNGGDEADEADEVVGVDGVDGADDDDDDDDCTDGNTMMLSDAPAPLPESCGSGDLLWLCGCQSDSVAAHVTQSEGRLGASASRAAGCVR